MTEAIHKPLTEQVIGVFYNVYNELGHGFPERVYERAFQIALSEKGLASETQVHIPVFFRGRTIAKFRADVVVEKTIILELKVMHDLWPAHEAQLLNYLRATTMEVGLLFNFGLTPKFKRLIFSNAGKRCIPKGNGPPLAR
jgi:GxxExxY protein